MIQSVKNTLSSLSGFPVKDDAMRGLATGNRTGKPAERKQEVLTPQCIVDVCNKVWGQIALDPCWCEGSLTNPIHKFEFPATDALQAPWIAFSYINPPYKDLKSWLAYGRTQPAEQIWLVPHRPHRKWWRKWRDHHLTSYCELNPLKFVGYDQAFPAPLLLGYSGSFDGVFMSAAQHLGSVYSFQPYSGESDANYR